MSNFIRRSVHAACVVAVVAFAAPSSALPTGSTQQEWPVPGDGSTPTSQHWMAIQSPRVASAAHAAEVTEMGDAAYSFALELPRGGRLMPDLSLQYRSSAGDDPEMHHGWTIGGVSEIVRPVERAFAGEMLLDGELLTPDGSGDYRLTTASSRYAIASYDSGDDSRMVSRKSGTVSHYDAADAGAAGPDGTQRWRVVEERDTHGNRILFSYDAAGRIAEIAYGANDGVGVDPLGYVTFYVPRHVSSSAHAGVVEWYNQVVASIDVSLRASDTAPVALVRSYVLNAIVSDGRMLLSGIDVVGDDGVTSRPGPSFGHQSYAGGKTKTKALGQVLQRVPKSPDQRSRAAGGRTGRSVWPQLRNDADLRPLVLDRRVCTRQQRAKPILTCRGDCCAPTTPVPRDHDTDNAAA